MARAPALQAGGRRFESVYLHRPKDSYSNVAVFFVSSRQVGLRIHPFCHPEHRRFCHRRHSQFCHPERLLSSERSRRRSEGSEASYQLIAQAFCTRFLALLGMTECAAWNDKASGPPVSRGSPAQCPGSGIGIPAPGLNGPRTSTFCNPLRYSTMQNNLVRGPFKKVGTTNDRFF